MLKATVAICGILLGLLLAFVVRAGTLDEPMAAYFRMAEDPWAAAALADLTVGLIFVAAWMAVVEPSPWRLMGWIVGLVLLGNMVTMAFLILRSRDATRFCDLFLPRRAGPTAER